MLKKLNRTALVRERGEYNDDYVSRGQLCKGGIGQFKYYEIQEIQHWEQVFGFVVQAILSDLGEEIFDSEASLSV